MKKLKFIAVFCFVIVHSYGQNKKYLVFSEELNYRLSQKFKDNSHGFRIVKGTTYSDTRILKSKTKSDAYDEAVAAYKKAKAEKYALSKNIDAILKKNEEIASIKANIADFLASKNSYFSKKHFLIDAQKVSEKYNFDLFVYADANINSKYKSKFFILSKDALRLKIHLKRVLASLDKKVKLLDVPNKKALNAAVFKAKQKLENTSQYIYSETEVTNKTFRLFIVGEKFNQPSKKFIGNYKNLGLFYVLESENGSELSGNTVIPVVLRKRKDFIDKPLLSNIKYTIIKDVADGNLYLLDPKFIKTYAINILANSTLYKGKTELPKKEYHFYLDKKIDQIIIDYNKKLIQ